MILLQRSHHLGPRGISFCILRFLRLGECVGLAQVPLSLVMVVTKKKDFHSLCKGLRPRGALFCVNRSKFFPLSFNFSFSSLDVKLGEPHLSSPAWKDMNCLISPPPPPCLPVASGKNNNLGAKKKRGTTKEMLSRREWGPELFLHFITPLVSPL